MAESLANISWQMTVTSDNKHKSLHQMINHQFVQSPVKCTKAEFIERLACLPSHIYRLKGFMTFQDTTYISHSIYTRTI